MADLTINSIKPPLSNHSLGQRKPKAKTVPFWQFGKNVQNH